MMVKSGLEFSEFLLDAKNTTCLSSYTISTLTTQSSHSTQSKPKGVDETHPSYEEIDNKFGILQSSVATLSTLDPPRNYLVATRTIENAVED